MTARLTLAPRRHGHRAFSSWRPGLPRRWTRGAPAPAALLLAGLRGARLCPRHWEEPVPFLVHRGAETVCVRVGMGEGTHTCKARRHACTHPERENKTEQRGRNPVRKRAHVRGGKRQTSTERESGKAQRQTASVERAPPGAVQRSCPGQDKPESCGREQTKQMPGRDPESGRMRVRATRTGG